MHLLYEHPFVFNTAFGLDFNFDLLKKDSSFLNLNAGFGVQYLSTGRQSGKVFFQNEQLNKSHPSRMGYLPEERGLYKKMKVGDHLIYLAQLKGLSVQDATRKCKTMLERFGALDWWHKKVEELSGGQLGYMYMPNTGQEGQTELLRQFYAQVHKKGFVIDERFNAGGQLADRFIEMLNRPVLYNLAWRNADVTVWPVKANNGPKVMLINGWAGSGGDAFPWAFQQLNLGPIIGERTLGILVGPATGHGLIDGGSITVPDARLYGADGKWFAEGYGIKPDIEVWDDPSLLAKGEDPQLKRAVEECMKLLQTKPRKLFPRPAFENRTAAGF